MGTSGTKSIKLLAKIIIILIFHSCSNYDKNNNQTKMSKPNPVIYFEIPVNDLNRAEKFYKNVMNLEFEKEIIDNYEMALFPFSDEEKGISGALAKGDVYKPTKNGVIIYFRTDNIDETLRKVIEQNGKILYQKVKNEKYGFYVAEFEDSEGNRIAIQETIKE